MGLELASAYIRVQADSSGLPGQFRGVREEVESSLDGIQKAILAVTGAVAMFGRSFIEAGVAAAASFEQTTIAFEVMLGSAEETKKILADLTQFAAKTPFEMPEILQAARGLIQFGERGDELMKTLNTLGNAASANSVPFGFLALVFNQVRGVGKLLTQDFRQLSTRGILSLQDLAKYYGKTTEEAEKMLSSGKVSFDDLKKILEGLSAEGGRFANMMEKQSHSLSGLKSTLNDAYRILGRVAATPIAEALKPVVGMLIKSTEIVGDLIGLMPELSAGLILGAEAAASLAASLTAAAIAARVLDVSLRSVLIGTGIGIGFIVLGAAVGAVIAGIAMLRKYLIPLEADAESVATSIENFAEAWENVKRAFSNTIDMIGRVTMTIVKLVAAFFGINLSSLPATVSETLAFVMAYISEFTLYVSRVALVMSENWDLTWELIELSAAAAWSYIQDIIQNAWASIAMIAQTAVDQGIALFDAMLESASRVWEGIWNVAEAVWNAVPVLISTAVRVGVQAFVMGMAIAADVFAQLPTLADASFAAIIVGFMGLSSVALDFGKGMFEINRVLFEQLPVLANAAFLIIAAGMKLLMREAAGMPALLLKAAAGIDISDDIEGIGTRVSAGLAKAVAMGGAGDAVDTIFAAAAQAVDDLGQGLDQVGDKTKKIFDIRGGNAAIQNIGAAVTNGLDIGIANITDSMRSPQLQGAISDIGDAVSTAFGRAGEPLATAFDQTVQAFSGLDLPGLLDTGSLTDALLSSASTVWQGIDGLASAVGPVVEPPAPPGDAKKGDDSKAGGTNTFESGAVAMDSWRKHLQDIVSKGDTAASRTAKATEDTAKAAKDQVEQQKEVVAELKKPRGVLT